MIYILFSPAEAKHFGGDSKQLNNDILFGLDKSKDILKKYNNVIKNNKLNELSELFGFKKESDIVKYSVDIFNSKTMSAIERYNGVAYDYLDFNSLNSTEKEYINFHTLIFSNLFGVLRADDKIPLYKIKQGNSIEDIKPEKYYNPILKDKLDNLLKSVEVLDLRAGYYDKFYKVTQNYTTMKFLKDGKVVSHFAKAYRGLVLRAMAKAKISSLAELSSLYIDNVVVHDIKVIKNKTEITFNILT
ncbi:MAG: peroxide stress protein YaaA [Helicobacteraceae bacterium]|nr:peroxide stress protein YaaA [Helicobacteraceae bacterium]